MKTAGPLCCLAVLLLPVGVRAQATGSGRPGPGEVRAPMGIPPELQGVGLDQRLGQSVPLDARFRTSTGREVRLGEYFGNGRPVLLVLAYYRCPMLCTKVLNDMTETLRGIKLTPGKDFTLLTVSFDPREGPEIAAAKKASYLESYGRPGAEAGWHFLTGEQEAIARLTEAVGFRYRYDAQRDQYAHASGLILLTPEGRTSRYFMGTPYQLSTITGTPSGPTFRTRDLELSIIEASKNRIGSPVDQVLLFCLQYDGATGKYTLAILNLVRAAGILTVLTILGLVVWARRREARRGAAGGASAAGEAALAVPGKPDEERS